MTILDIESATELIESSITAGRCGFFVNTEFGRIAIEVNVKELMIIDPIIINTWENAPSTKWAMKYRHKSCDFHVIIERAKTPFATHCRVIRALSQCLLMHVFEEEVDENVLDAAVRIYLTNIDNQTITTNFLEREYSLNHLNIVSRQDIGVLNLVRDLVTRRDNDAMALLEVGQKLSKNSRNGWEPSMIFNFDIPYYRDLIYIILFIAELTSRNLIMSLGMNEVRTIELSNNNIISESRYINGMCTLKMVSLL